MTNEQREAIERLNIYSEYEGLSIEENEYVRTKKGYFYKIKRIRKSDVSKEVYIVREHGDNYSFYLRKDNIKKHSKNIIDLIEVRRYSFYTRCTK